MVSHDREFLDDCIDHVMSINRTTIDVQSGNFTSWYENKVKQNQYEQSQNEKLKKDIKRLEESARQSKIWSDKVENSKNGVKVSGVKPDKGHIGHQAAKMMKQSKNLEKRQGKAIEKKKGLLRDLERQADLRLRNLDYRKELFIQVDDVSFAYDEIQVIDKISFEVKKGDRIAILGGNGSGKSTLIKLLLGQLEVNSGKITRASGLNISYISQSTSHLNGSLRKFIEEEGIQETLCKTILSQLGFSRETFKTPLEKYSDGQKKKLLIASSLAKEAHLYIWDEPLNYIDVLSRIQIEEILISQKLTIVFVEHDGRFVNDVAIKTVQL